MNLHIVKNRNYFFIFSGILVVAGLFSLYFWGLKPGIDFTGGSFLEIKLNNQSQVNAQEMATQIQAAVLDIGEVRVQPTASGFIARSRHLTEAQHQSILATMDKLYPADSTDATQVWEEVRFESVGPMIGVELKNKAIWALALAMAAIILYIAWSFRKVSRPVVSWKYGVGAVIALMHDLIIVTGAFAIFGHFFGYEVDLLFVSALLTILGFSVHDTIVVYDRTRENLIYSPQKTFDETLNKAINETIHRSINTSLTVFLVLLALYVLGGVSTQNFVLALMIGVVIGTYSSIFVASTLLIVWQRLGSRKN
ncbi:MAG TPA: protein translocase subunit SecF [bacterium]|nr:protein translocase subunit SecF [bacterium]